MTGFVYDPDEKTVIQGAMLRIIHAVSDGQKTVWRMHKWVSPYYTPSAIAAGLAYGVQHGFLRLNDQFEIELTEKVQ